MASNDDWVNPDSAGLVVDFVNTGGETAGKPEQFGDADAFARWATESGLGVTALVVEDSDLVAARGLRLALRSVLRHHSDAASVSTDRLRDALDYLAEAGRRYPLRSVVTDRGVRLIAQGAGVPHMLGTVLAAAAESEFTGRWSRIKACSSSPCEKAFIDLARNHSARYCSPGCASRATMRRQRQLHRQQ